MKHIFIIYLFDIININIFVYIFGQNLGILLTEKYIQNFILFYTETVVTRWTMSGRCALLSTSTTEHIVNGGDGDPPRVSFFSRIYGWENNIFLYSFSPPIRALCSLVLWSTNRLKTQPNWHVYWWDFFWVFFRTCIAYCRVRDRR